MQAVGFQAPSFARSAMRRRVENLARMRNGATRETMKNEKQAMKNEKCRRHGAPGSHFSFFIACFSFFISPRSARRDDAPGYACAHGHAEGSAARPHDRAALPAHLAP